MREMVQEWVKEGEFRYPGDNAPPEDVKDALDKTGKVKDFIMQKIEEG